MSHVRSCTGGAYGEKEDRKQCGGCKRWVSQANYARHVRTGGRIDEGGDIGGRDVGVGNRRGGQVRMVTCDGYGRATWPGTREGCAECGTREGGRPLTGVDGPYGWMVTRSSIKIACPAVPFLVTNKIIGKKEKNYAALNDFPLHHK